MAHKPLKRRIIGLFDVPGRRDEGDDIDDEAGVLGGPASDSGLFGGPAHSSGLFDAPDRSPGEMPGLFDRPHPGGPRRPADSVPGLFDKPAR